MKGPDSAKIKNIFSDVAVTYDKVNDAMTFGMARKWRKKVVELSGCPKDGRILDCATGTGDLAIEFKRQLGPKANVIGMDFCKEMLDLAPQKAKDLGLEVTFEEGDILNLKYPDQTFDAVSVAYGIRNVEDTQKGIEEMWRVLKPKGKVLILETGESQSLTNKPVAFYTKYIVPYVGGLISKKKPAYDYLSSSSRAFPAQKEFLKFSDKLPGLKKASFKTLIFGASYIYIFEKE